MPNLVVDFDKLLTLAGTDLGVTEYREITQEQINKFADATGDEAPAITLYDVPGASLSADALRYLTHRPGSGRLVLYAWDIRPDAVGAG